MRQKWFERQFVIAFVLRFIFFPRDATFRSLHSPNHRDHFASTVHRYEIHCILQRDPLVSHPAPSATLNWKRFRIGETFRWTIDVRDRRQNRIKIAFSQQTNLLECWIINFSIKVRCLILLPFVIVLHSLRQQQQLPLFAFWVDGECLDHVRDNGKLHQFIHGTTEQSSRHSFMSVGRVDRQHTASACSDHWLTNVILLWNYL